MKKIDLTKLPERWAVNVEEEKNNPRIQEFKDMFCITFDCYAFGFKYYGFNINPDKHEEYNHFGNKLPKGITLINLIEFFKSQEIKRYTSVTYGASFIKSTFVFEPKEDITLWELAQCLKFAPVGTLHILSDQNEYIPDEPFMRHFKQVR